MNHLFRSSSVYLHQLHWCSHLYHNTKECVCVCVCMCVYVCVWASGQVLTSERLAVWSRHRGVTVAPVSAPGLRSISRVSLAADWLYLSPPVTITVWLPMWLPLGLLRLIEAHPALPLITNTVCVCVCVFVCVCVRVCVLLLSLLQPSHELTQTDVLADGHTDTVKYIKTSDICLFTGIKGQIHPKMKIQSLAFHQHCDE